MSTVDLTAEKYEKHREAGRILAEVREAAAERVEVGASHLDVAEWTEERIRELGAEPAFPVNISIDHEAAHATPSADDDTTFGEEMVNLDIGVHVDGRLADTAITVDLSGNPDLKDATEDALDTALDIIEPGIHTGAIGSEIENVIDGYGFNPVVNLTGHGLGHWKQHTPPNIPNRAVDSGVELTVGDVVAIEPFATDGGGKVNEGTTEQIFALERERSVRNRQARQAINQITDQYRTLPFATRWLDVSRAEMAVRRLKQANIVHGYPVLQEDEGNLVSQKEHTVIITEDGCEVTTKAE
jgi:methionyl aminopeptidase